MTAFDVIVIGTGGVGSAALFHLARRGLRVLGLDRFPPGHDRGSSHGQTRIIRQAYFEHPDYVPLLRRAYELWAELESLTGRRLYHEIGLLQVGPFGGELVSGVLHSAALHQLDVVQIDDAEFAGRFPGFALPSNYAAVFEARAGYLFVEECVRAHAEAAVQAGAQLHTGEAVVDWRPDGGVFAVQTAANLFTAQRLVIAGGAWAGQLLPTLGIPLRVLRKHLHWYACEDASYRGENGCPTFLFETAAGDFFYGFPAIGPWGVKVAEHTGGDEVLDPLQVDRSLDARDRQRVERFMREFMPRMSHRHLQHDVCLYTMSPDQHFLVDHHPQDERVVFAAGLSGHGFKFTAVLGEILADLVYAGRSQLPIDFLRRDRPSLTGHMLDKGNSPA